MNAPVHRLGEMRQQGPTPVKPGGVEPTLAALWSELTGAGDEHVPITRACMSNLIVYCSKPDEAQDLLQEIPHIVHQHPARVLVLGGGAQPQGQGIQGSVSVLYCPTSEGWQVCSEWVHIQGPPEAGRKMASLVRSLLIGDLPTALWWHASEPPVMAGQMFQDLMEMSEQVIYDSIGWLNPARGIRSMARLINRAHSEQTLFNLAWRRLKPWRHLVRQVLDPAVEPGAVDAIEVLQVEHGPHAMPMAWLLVGWLAAQLGWRPMAARILSGTEASWRFISAERAVDVLIRRRSEGAPVVDNLSIGWNLDGDTKSARFEMIEAGRLGVVETASSVPARVIAAHEPTRAQLISAQLAFRARDHLFEKALKVSATMADALGS
jgi:glucose-6-phosphate dehydrogenase assembly protein OpcA